MGTRSIVETRRDRKALVADAGYQPLSIVSVLAGVLSAYGAFAVLAGIAVGVIKAADVDVDLASQWQDLGVAGGLVVAALLLGAYLFGGYVAGRMARRSGTVHGVAVFIVGVLLAAGGAWLARQLGGADVATDNLRDLGLPTTGAEWRDVATVAGVASLAAMLVGALLGGVLGERWHDKLLRRALDPSVGAEARAHRDAERRAAQAEELRTTSYQRVRTASPTRTRRVDGDVAGDGIVARDRNDDKVPAKADPTPTSPALPRPVPHARSWRDRTHASSDGSSFWHRRRGGDVGGDVDGDGDRDRDDVEAATGRPTAPSAGRTG